MARESVTTLLGRNPALRRMEEDRAFGAAWRMTAALVPEGYSLSVSSTVGVTSGPFVAVTDYGAPPRAFAYADSPLAALLLLADKLRTTPSPDPSPASQETEPHPVNPAFVCLEDGAAFAREDDGIYRCPVCREMWCECCTQNGTYCRHDCPSHPKPTSNASAWFGMPWLHTVTSEPQ